MTTLAPFSVSSATSLRKIDAIALTNLGQIRRLIEIACARSCEGRLRQGLECIPIASVGPAVSDELESHGLRTDIYLAEDAFFMRAVDLGDGGGAWQVSAACGCQILTRAARNRRTIHVPAESERKNELLTRETHRPIVVRSLSTTSNRSRLLSQRLKLPAWST